VLSGLNDQQKVAVETEGHALVIACPGSGKTRVLTRKIAYELERLLSKKKQIVALTFTNRAADEIQKRIDDLGVPTGQLWTGTIHSFCIQWIIKPYAGYIKELKNGFKVMDEYMSFNLLNKLKEKYNLQYYEDIITRFDRDGNYINNKHKFNLIAQEYHTDMLKKRFIDFDLILHYSYQLIRKYPKISQHLAKLFTHVFVDEYQDTQDLQYAILGEIVKASNGMCNIFLVGDPDQAIYSSLGGTAKSIFEIEQEIGGYLIKPLELAGNYRSTQRIVDFFSQFQSTDLSIESLAVYAEEAGTIFFNHTIEKSNLYKEIANIIRREIRSGIKPHDICVIAPRWEFLTSISKKLKEMLPNVPFEASGLTPLPRNKDNFWYKLSQLFLTIPSPEIYQSRIRWSKQILEELNSYTGAALSTDSNDCRKFLKLINSIRIDEQEGILYLEKAFTVLFQKMDIDLHEHTSLADQWNSFFSGIQDRYSSEEFKDVPDDIDYYKKMMEPSKGVVINTCHGVKGEEFETVIAFGLLWGYVPHWNSIIRQPNSTANSASNKLLYVISSRAKKNLYLIAEEGRLTGSRRPYEINHQLSSIEFEFDEDVLAFE
jgi:DNA helicase II / ATP-dependent DNA helicase PcrA